MHRVDGSVVSYKIELKYENLRSEILSKNSNKNRSKILSKKGNIIII